jgi:uncharacterized UBP type Zn finger protein
LGNTCYLNGPLQCLLHLPNVRRALLGRGHTPMCCLAPAFCASCALKAIASTAFDGTHAAFVPTQLTSHLCDLNPEFEIDVQSDAHELTRCLLTAATPQFCSFGFDDAHVDQSSTQMWFHGSLRTQTICATCLSVSIMTDDFFDLSLELVTESGEDISSVSAALANFTQTVTVI